MTKKVKITQEQADAINKLKEGQRKTFREFFKENKDWLQSWAIPLTDLTEDEYMSALYDGYEVEPTFKVGDWATEHEGEGYRTGKVRLSHEGIVTVRFKGLEEPFDFYDATFRMSEVSKSTPCEIREEKERRKWLKIKLGDVLRGRPSGRLAIYVKDFPEHREVQVQLHNGSFQTWDRDRVELYAKKVGGTNANNN